MSQVTGSLIERIIGCVTEEVDNIEFGRHDFINIDRVISEKYCCFFTVEQKKVLRSILHTIAYELSGIVWKDRELKEHFKLYLSQFRKNIEISENNISVEDIFIVLNSYVEKELPLIYDKYRTDPDF